MTVRLNEVAIERLFNSPESTVSLYVRARAERVEQNARDNASGGYIDIRSQALIDLLSTQPSPSLQGLGYTVGSSATSPRGSYPYPAHIQRGEITPAEPLWLTAALDKEFAT